MAQSSNWTARFVEELAHERAGYATGPVTEDAFYTVDEQWETEPPGTMLRVEAMNASLYTMPPATSGVRILYQSENFSGTNTPASGVVLFPYTPRNTRKGEIPVIVWAHGTCGLFANGAPSHYRNLWGHFTGPYVFALQGFIVIIPDYAGLGVSIDGRGNPIVHEYLAAPAAAKDMEYAVKAAQSAFAEVGSQFVAIGHSQGGNVVWGFAERMHTNPVQGYLGAIPISPVTNILKEPMPFRGAYMAAALWGLQNIFPEFDMKSILTEEGQERMKANKDIGANVVVTKALLFADDFFVPGWEDNEYIQKFNNLTHTGGRPVAGPVLVVQGEKDPMISTPVVTAATEETAKVSPGVSIQYHLYANITHTPVTFAAQHACLDWIIDRFNEKEMEAGLTVENFKPLRPADTYPVRVNWYVELATKPYHTP
ncbi:alpha/beta-hydrolase [Periconia macrospinosa]|uniref:Alpha/beta-hydrolase n=1 Tax=Periconia macrospinosa TaxID=97972 RepID=A0A2V1DUR0_9PLEO|nr:alpha/beta-hydrolase [Periconia macrospinosa]